jgi:Raf kinase inhibitor-like YbhB/YbcL family protein
LEIEMTLTLTSPAFADGETIPRKYTRDGDNLFPPISWTGAPDGVESYMLILEDPDAPSGTFRHCAITNIPADASELPQAVDTAPDWPFLKFARNDFGNARYDGPEPPRGHGVHHYHFRLAALDVPNLGVPPQADIDKLWQEARKHMVEEAELMGTYAR